MHVLMLAASMGLAALGALAQLASNPSHGAVLNVMVADAISYGYGADRVTYSPSQDGGEQWTIAAAFLLAVAHFNARNSHVLPVLGQLGACSDTINVFRYCDTRSQRRRPSPTC